jgi:enamine deaminase RidA (YjgF/YER057c/UK114 family)
MAGEVEVRLARLGLTLEAPPRPIASFLPFRVAGGLVFLAGQTCERGGAVPYVGRVGVELDLERGKQAARQCALNLLAALRAACDGDLDRVERCVRVGGFVQAQPGFLLVPQVIDGASEVFVSLWGEDGRHARTAVGVATLPQNAAVEVDAIFALRGPRTGA